MKIGQLRHKATIERKVHGENALGDPIIEWQVVARPWIAIEPIRGEEYWTAAQVQAETTHKVTMRYVEGVTPSDRLVLNAGPDLQGFIGPSHPLYAQNEVAGTDVRVFEIESVLNLDERNRWLELMCKETRF